MAKIHESNAECVRLESYECATFPLLDLFLVRASLICSIKYKLLCNELPGKPTHIDSPEIDNFYEFNNHLLIDEDQTHHFRLADLFLYFSV